MGLRITTIIGMACFSIAAFGLYIVKYTVENLHRDVEAVRAEVVKEQESLHLLNAEWAYLNRPERLRGLAETHLALSPLDSRRIDNVQSLPAAYDEEVGEPGAFSMIQPAAGTGVK